MQKSLNLITVIMAMGIFSGCIPAPKPQIGIGLGGIGEQHSSTSRERIGERIESSKTPSVVVTQPVIDKEYGVKPLNYTIAIRRYFATKIPRGNLSVYKFSEPKRAYKRKGLAYGGAIDWKGWLVETSIAIPTRTGRMLTPKPYMVLFSGEQIIDHILGYSHKLIVKVDK